MNATTAGLSDTQVDLIFHALADATRRDIIRQTIEGEHSVSALARRYPMSVTAVQKHVATLERAELVTRTRKGSRTDRDQQGAKPCASANAARRDRSLWRGRIDRIGSLLAEDNQDITAPQENNRT